MVLTSGGLKERRKLPFIHFYTHIYVFENVFIIVKIVNKTREFSNNFGKINSEFQI